MFDEQFGVTLATKLLESLRNLASVDTVIVDAGSATSPWMSVIREYARELVVVTTESADAIMHSYALIKHLCSVGTASHMSLLVNQAASPATAREVQNRMVTSCDRFLNLYLEPCGSVPDDDRIPLAERSGRPYVLFAPHSQAAHQINAIGLRIESSPISNSKRCVA
jgi:flagellar biosynthesis protein FlhG